MKIFLALLIFTSTCYGQTDPLKSNSTISKSDAQFFDSLFIKKRGAYTFEGKKIGFISGIAANNACTKTYFFNNLINPYLERNQRPIIIYKELTDNEKNESGGFDVVVMQVPKIIRPKDFKKTLQNLKQVEVGK